MFDVNGETGVFHNIYKIGIEKETTRGVLHEGNESGEGTMQRFEVAPGIQITYNDLKKISYKSIIVWRDAMSVNWKVAPSVFWGKETFVWITSPKISRYSVAPAFL